MPIDLSPFAAIVEQAAAPPAWTHGHEPALRVLHPAGQSLILGFIALMLFAGILVFSHFRRTVIAAVQDLWNVRQRSNAFDDGTPGRRRIQLLMSIQFVVFCGILLYSALVPAGISDTHTALLQIVALIGLMTAYYLFQLAAYSVVAFAFATDTQNSRRWLEGFRASQGLAGAVLAVPALCIIFNGHTAPAMLAVAAAVYLLARIIFIIKGFRIFYTGPTSLVYFILYLCTLEIVPLLALFSAASAIVAA